MSRGELYVAPYYLREHNVELSASIRSLRVVVKNLRAELRVVKARNAELRARVKQLEAWNR